MNKSHIELLPEFIIKVESNGINTKIGQVLEEENIIELLSFSEDNLDEILQTHAANQAYWEALAVKLKNKYKSFEDEWCKKWWAHNRTYARYVLIGYGDSKPTAESSRDMIISIYSEDVTPIERDKFFEIAHSAATKKGIEYGLEEFRNNMYKYIFSDPSWYFETVTRTLNKLIEDYEIVHTVAKNLYARSFHIDGLINLVKPKKSNMEPMSVSEKNLMNSTSNITRR